MSHATAPIPESTHLDPTPLDFEMVYSDGEPLDTFWHSLQLSLFTHVLRMALVAKGRHDFFVGGNLFVYYSPDQARAISAEVLEEAPPDILYHPKGTFSRRHFKGPDAFAVVGGIEPGLRDAWVIWEENNRAPDVVAEFMSKKTVRLDRGAKKKFYAETFRSPEYFYYGPDSPDLPKKDRDNLVGLRLVDGSYEEIQANEQSMLWSEVLGAFVGRWDGEYEGQEGRWIRLYDADCQLIPTEAEANDQRAKAKDRQLEVKNRQLEAKDAEIARLRKLLGS